MAAGKGFWGKLGTSMKNVTPEQWKAGAIITDKFSGGSTGYLGTALATSGTSLDGIRKKDTRNKQEPPGVNETPSNTSKKGQASFANTEFDTGT